VGGILGRWLLRSKSEQLLETMTIDLIIPFGLTDTKYVLQVANISNYTNPLGDALIFLLRAVVLDHVRKAHSS
jgi:hypothetical protein